MCIVTMKSMTLALRAKNVLGAKGIDVDVQNLDPSVTARGCAYGLSFICSDKEYIQRLLDGKCIPYGEWIGGVQASAAVRNDIL